MIIGILQIFILVTAVSMDAFAAAFAYGVSKIRVPLLSVIIVSGISAITLLVSLLAGGCVRELLPPGFTRGLSFTILFVLGIVKIFDHSGKKEAEEANRDGDNLLSYTEAVSLGAALSLDSIAAGIGAGVMTGGAYVMTSGAFAIIIYVLETVIATLLISSFMMLLGSRMGTVIAGKIHVNLSWIGGVLIIGLAFMRIMLPNG